MEGLGKPRPSPGSREKARSHSDQAGAFHILSLLLHLQPPLLQLIPQHSPGLRLTCP